MALNNSPNNDAYYPGAVPRVAAFLHNGTFDFPGFRRALNHVGDLAQGHLTYVLIVARATGAWPPLEDYCAEAVRLHLRETIAGGLGQASQEASSLSAIHPGAVKDLGAARQLILASMKEVQDSLRSTLPPPSPVAEVFRRYATARARWVEAMGANESFSKKQVKHDQLAPARAEVNAAGAKDALAAVKVELQQAQQAITAALSAIRDVTATDSVARAEQEAWVTALGGAIPRSVNAI